MSNSVKVKTWKKGDFHIDDTMKLPAKGNTFMIDISMLNEDQASTLYANLTSLCNVTPVFGNIAKITRPTISTQSIFNTGTISTSSQNINNIETSSQNINIANSMNGPQIQEIEMSNSNNNRLAQSVRLPILNIETVNQQRLKCGLKPYNYIYCRICRTMNSHFYSKLPQPQMLGMFW